MTSPTILIVSTPDRDDFKQYRFIFRTGTEWLNDEPNTWLIVEALSKDSLGGDSWRRHKVEAWDTILSMVLQYLITNDLPIGQTTEIGDLVTVNRISEFRFKG